MRRTNRQYIREQRTLCGKNYAEVDFCRITEKEHKASPRAKKKFASSLAQQGRNAERARRVFVQILNTNFDEQGFALVLTYEDASLPDDDEQAWRDVRNYLQRIRRWVTRRWGKQKIKWVCVTEHQAENPELGVKEVRYHHHMVLQVDGLSAEQRATLRQTLEDQWHDAEGYALGTVNADRLQPEHDSLEGLAKYMLKYPKRHKRWHASRGLERPAYPQPRDTHWTARKLADACTLRVDDADYWEALYPGYRFLEACPTYNEERGEWRLYIKLRRKRR